MTNELREAARALLDNVAEDYECEGIGTVDLRQVANLREALSRDDAVGDAVGKARACPRCAMRDAELYAAANCVCSAGTNSPTIRCEAHKRLDALVQAERQGDVT